MRGCGAGGEAFIAVERRWRLGGMRRRPAAEIMAVGAGVNGGRGSARRRDASGRRRPLQASLCRGRRRLYGVNGGRGGVRAHGIGGGRETCGVRRVRPSDGAPQRACAANGPGVAQPNAASACGWLHGSGWLGTARRSAREGAGGGVRALEEQAGSGERPREGAGARGVVARPSRAEQGKGAGPVLCRVREGGRRREEGEGRRKERKGGKEKKRERKWEKEKEKGGEREGKKRGGERSAPGSRR